jgi:hypothetical protein
VLPIDIQRLHILYRRSGERRLKRDKRNLFLALQDFANVRPNQQGWVNFRKRWPGFFPDEEYERVKNNSTPNIADYPQWVDGLWEGAEPEPILSILLGLKPPPDLTSVESHEDAYGHQIASMPTDWWLDWGKGAFVYESTCDFQRALYLLYRESWRARICIKCAAKFIARRAAQKYCSTDCSEGIQQELKRKWWAEHGEKWRRERKVSHSRKKGERNVTHKTR